MLTGDFNSHHEMWGNIRTDQRGRILEEFLITAGMNILNNGAATHISGTAVDLTIISPELEAAMQWIALPTVLSSNQYPILMTIFSKGTGFDHAYDIVNFKKGNWKKYREDGHLRNLGALPENAEQMETKLNENFE